MAHVNLWPRARGIQVLMKRYISVAASTCRNKERHASGMR